MYSIVCDLLIYINIFVDITTRDAFEIVCVYNVFKRFCLKHTNFKKNTVIFFLSKTCQEKQQNIGRVKFLNRSITIWNYEKRKFQKNETKQIPRELWPAKRVHARVCYTYSDQARVNCCFFDITDGRVRRYCVRILERKKKINKCWKPIIVVQDHFYYSTNN